MKRLFDVVVSLVALSLFSPIFLVVSVCIFLQDYKSIIFKQIRVGKDGQLFKMYKFRSMVSNASDIGPHFTAEKDKRITRIGAFLRKTSLDELPQLLNVLKGDMSCVGPRPNVPQQKPDYSEKDWNARNTVKPGITGLAQATDRSQASPEQRLKMDLYYANNATLLLDLKIILLTFKQVFLRGGN